MFIGNLTQLQQWKEFKRRITQNVLPELLGTLRRSLLQTTSCRKKSFRVQTDSISNLGTTLSTGFKFRDSWCANSRI